MHELSSPRVDQSARCPVRELAIRELAYPRVVQLPFPTGEATQGELQGEFFLSSTVLQTIEVERLPATAACSDFFD